VHKTVATLERSDECSWIKWTLLPPLISLVRPGSQFHGPRGGGGHVRAPTVIVARYVFHKNELILVSRTLSAHWFDLAGTLRSYTPEKWWKLEKFRLNLIIFEVHATGTLLSWAFVEDMNWTKSSQHFYAIGLTWEPLSNRIVYLEKIMKIWTISAYFDHFWSLCYGQHCSFGLLWGL